MNYFNTHVTPNQLSRYLTSTQIAENEEALKERVRNKKLKKDDAEVEDDESIKKPQQKAIARNQQKKPSGQIEEKKLDN